MKEKKGGWQSKVHESQKKRKKNKKKQAKEELLEKGRKGAREKVSGIILITLDFVLIRFGQLNFYRLQKKKQKKKKKKKR